MKFKDYEYGWYLHAGSFKGTFIQSGQACHNLYQVKRLHNFYTSTLNGLLNQVPKIKDVKFIYGDYREV